MGAGRLIAATAPSFVLIDRLARVWWPGTLRLERQIKARGPVNYCPLYPSAHASLTVPLERADLVIGIGP